MRHYTTTFGLAALVALVAAAGCGQAPGDPAGGSQAGLHSQSEPIDDGGSCSPVSVDGFLHIVAHHTLARSFEYYDFSHSRTICPGATVLGPAQCSEGYKLMKLRGLVVTSQMESEQAPDAMNGTVTFTFNQNADANGAGPVWGKWHTDLDGGCGTWDGTWNGYRVAGCGTNPVDGSAYPTPCVTQATKVVGRGTSGTVKGLHQRGRGDYAIYTPGFDGWLEGELF